MGHKRFTKIIFLEDETPKVLADCLEYRRQHPDTHIVVYEEMAAVTDSTLTGEHKTLTDQHLETCTECRVEIQNLKSLT